MRYRPDFTRRTAQSLRINPLLIVDIGLAGALLFLPNLLLAMNLLHLLQAKEQPLQFSNLMRLFLTDIDLPSALLWLTINFVFAGMVFVLRRHVFYPMIGIIKHLYGMLGALAQEGPGHTPVLVSLRRVAGEMGRMAQLAQEYYLKHQDAQMALTQARAVLSQINLQQKAILETTSREMMAQYQSVLTYANYLEEQIARHAVDPALRYDFDDVSESGFNLKLIAGALGVMDNYTPQQVRIDVAQLMQQTILALVPSLDRRAMKLTTVEVDVGVIAMGDPSIVTHVLWMMLLGTIRYAADESTLRLRCLYNREQNRALISIVVSELSPGKLTENERSAFLLSTLHHLTPHMFAETIRIQANMQLAELLLRRVEGAIDIVPLTSHSCEICLTLPVG